MKTLLLFLWLQQPAPPPQPAVQPPKEVQLDFQNLSAQLGICQGVLTNKAIYQQNLEAYAAYLQKRVAELEKEKAAVKTPVSE